MFEAAWFISFVSSVSLLALVMDPLGNVPVLLGLLKGVENKRLQTIIMRELGFALGLLLLAFFGGERLMGLLGISAEAIKLSGGIILFIIALQMIFPSKEGPSWSRGQEEAEPYMVPIATPLIAGPSTLATVVLLASNKDVPWWSVLLAVIVAWVITAVVILSAPWINRVVPERGLNALEKLMGMLLVTVAVQMFVDGVRQVF